MSDEDPVETGKIRGDFATRIKPGQALNPRGRPRGARNRLGNDFVSALQDDFEAHGPATIAKVREERPQDYLKVIASILPKELNVTMNAVTEMSDDDLATALAALEHLVAAKHAPSRGDEETKH